MLASDNKRGKGERKISRTGRVNARAVAAIAAAISSGSPGRSRKQGSHRVWVAPQRLGPHAFFPWISWVHSMHAPSPPAGFVTWTKAHITPQASSQPGKSGKCHCAAPAGNRANPGHLA